jgi:ribonuclease III
MDNINNCLITEDVVTGIINKYLSIYYDHMKFKTDPFNLNEAIGCKEERITIKINDIKNIQKAFIHKSFWVKKPEQDETDMFSCLKIDKDEYGDYENAEFRGDKVIELITLDYLLDLYPDKDPGFLTELKSRIVRKESLANLSEQLHLKKYILFNSHIDRITAKKDSSGRENKRFLEDTFESFIGNLYVDQKYNKEIIKPFLLGVYIAHIDLDYFINNDNNYKTNLLKKFHYHKFNPPKYTKLFYTGPPTNRTFVSVVLLDTIIVNKANENPNFQTFLQKTEEKQNYFVNLLNNEHLNAQIAEFPQKVGEEEDTPIKKLIKALSIKTIYPAVENHRTAFLKLLEFIEPEKETTPYQFLVSSLNNKYLLGIGSGSKTQEAEQECSKDCLELMSVLK